MVCSRGFSYKNYITVIDDVSNERKRKAIQNKMQDD